MGHLPTQDANSTYVPTMNFGLAWGMLGCSHHPIDGPRPDPQPPYEWAHTACPVAPIRRAHVADAFLPQNLVRREMHSGSIFWPCHLVLQAGGEGPMGKEIRNGIP